MRIFRTILITSSMALIFTVNAYAGETHSGRAVQESGQASTHASASTGHALVGSAQATSAVAAMPLYVTGAVGAVSTEIADELMEAATAPAGEPLAITEESMTVGPTPDAALRGDI